MSGRRFDVADVADALLMWQAGHTSREIAGALGMGRDRIRAIVRRAQMYGYNARVDPLSREEWRERVATMFAERAFPPLSVQRQELEQLRDAIERGLETETAAAVWRRLHDKEGLDVAERTFRRYASELRAAYPDHQRMSKALMLELEAARQRIRELEAELDPQRATLDLGRTRRRRSARRPDHEPTSPAPVEPRPSRRRMGPSVG